MDKVKKLIRAGATTATAIKESLGMRLGEFAEKYALPPTVLSAAINGDRRATDAMIDAFVTELGGTPDEWRFLLWEGAKPKPEAEVA
jgi:plasmid maintenance system antidote protein VapI